MRIKNIVGVFAAILFAFAVVACNDDLDPTPAPAPSAAAASEAPAA